jgi:hypothetical protein
MMNVYVCRPKYKKYHLYFNIFVYVNKSIIKQLSNANAQFFVIYDIENIF